MEYFVYGDYALDTECELEVFKNETRAIQFVKGYTKFGDMGGYNRIEVIVFAPSGECVTLYRVDSEDVSDELLYDEA
jgi:hypothetical protein